jgi:hypothetical protein
MFTRQHYEAIARVLREERPEPINEAYSYLTTREQGCRDEWDTINVRFMQLFRHDNPAFNDTRWNEMVGVNDFVR